MFYLGEGVLEPGPSSSPMLAFLKILEFKREETQHQLWRSIGALTERAASQRLVPPPGGLCTRTLFMACDNPHKMK